MNKNQIETNVGAHDCAQKTKNIAGRNHAPLHHGITLIALIVTIIVLLILAGVAISITVDQDNLFDKAEQAKTDWNQKVTEEQSSIDDILVQLGIEPPTEITTDLPNGWNNEAVKEVVKQGTRTAPIPVGFVASQVEGENSIIGGLVIYEGDTPVTGEANSTEHISAMESRNQYVWIPVDDGKLDRTGWWKNEPTDKTAEEIAKELTEEQLWQYIALDWGYETMEDLLEDFEFSSCEEYLEWGGYTSINDAFKEVAQTNGFTIEHHQNLTETFPEELISSVNKYKGFYIGRYETGTTVEPRTDKENKTSENIVVQKGAYPYNWCCWGTSLSNYTADVIDTKGRNQGKGAVLLSEEMYNDKTEYGVVSTLCYGAEWDEILNFVRNSKHNVNESTSWGNYSNSKFTFTGKYMDYETFTWTNEIKMNEEKSENNCWLLTTGASEKNKAKNVYDLAGNVCEHTMEWNYFTGTEARPSSRGSSAGFPNYGAAAVLYWPVDIAHVAMGFRTALYVKN